MVSTNPVLFTCHGFRVGLTFGSMTVNDNVTGSQAPVTLGSTQPGQWSNHDTGGLFGRPTPNPPFPAPSFLPHTDPVSVSGSTPSLLTHGSSLCQTAAWKSPSFLNIVQSVAHHKWLYHQSFFKVFWGNLLSNLKSCQSLTSNFKSHWNSLGL